MAKKNDNFDPSLVEKAFDAEQSTVLLSLLDGVEGRVSQAVENAIENLASSTKDELGLGKQQKALLRDQKRLNQLARIWKNNGYMEGCSDRISVTELLEKDIELTNEMRDNFSSDHPLLVPRVISNLAREAIEPNLVLTGLLQRMNFTYGTQISFPAFGAIAAADIPEGGEYPERSLELAGQVTATIGKSGVAVKVTEEMMRYSLFDIMGLHFRAAGRALARLKEQKVWDLISTNGTTHIDNNVAAVRSSTGRGPTGAFNGGLTLEDLFYVYAKLVDDGFVPNALIMHPFAWQIFAQEGIARAFGFVNGVNPLLWQSAQGAAGKAPGFAGGGLNRNTYVSEPQQLATTFTNVPSIFPTNFRIIVSPYVTFNAATLRTTVVMCDVNELGLLVVDEDVVTDEWTDPARDIKKVKFRERYGLAVLNDGKGIGLMKDIFVGKTFDFADRLTLSADTGTLGSLWAQETGHYGDV